MIGLGVSNIGNTNNDGSMGNSSIVSGMYNIKKYNNYKY